MITKTRQAWTPGQTVKVGFMNLVVKAAIPTPGDWLPDAYLLSNAAGTQLYKFVPHNGLEKVSPLEARELLASATRDAELAADRAIAKARADADMSSAVNKLFSRANAGGQK